MNKSYGVVVPTKILEALGRVVVAHGQSDAIIRSLFWSMAGLSPSMGRCITGELKTPMLCDMIVELAKQRAIDHRQISHLEKCFTELSRLTEERNKLTHWPWGLHSTMLESIKFPTSSLIAI